MTRTRGLFIAFAVAIGLLFFGLVLRQGASTVRKNVPASDSAAGFVDDPIAPAALQSTISWAADGPIGNRKMEPGTREDITVAYAQAWSLLGRIGRGESVDLSTYFSLGALAQATSLMDNKSTKIEMKRIGQILTLLSYSDDGAIVTFAAEMKSERLIGQGDHVVQLSSNDNLRVLMVLEDGRWHLHAIERVVPV